MGTMINRRRVMESTEKDNLTLIHSWDADNWTGGNWVDIVGGRSATIKGTPSKVLFEGKQYIDLSYDKYFIFSQINNSSIGINLGDVWRVDVEFSLQSLPSGVSYLCDFGSLRTCHHGFGISVARNGYFFFNPKLNGNDSASDYYIRDIQVSQALKGKLSLGMERVNDTQNIMYALYEGRKYYSPNVVSREIATFNKNFTGNTDGGLAPDGLTIGCGCYRDTSTQSLENKYIKSVKIYKLIEG